jgi:hypothetical protein
MKYPQKIIHVSVLSAALLFCCGLAAAQTPKKLDRKPSSASPVNSSEASDQIRLKLVDGTRIQVDEAWESEQGIWYRRAGISHLLERDRVKAIERGALKPTKDLQPAKLIAVKANDDDFEGQPVWIYLKGGARVEADSATESASGVWYRRGSLTVFVDRSRIDHIEREDLENLAESSVKERGWSTGNSRIDGLIRENGKKHGVDPYLIFCVMEQESHFNSRALSPKGARGLMQLMPGTSARFGVRRPSDPAQNIAGGTRFLKQLMEKFSGRVDLVLASYNAGEGAVIKFGHKVPPYRETREYVKRISYRYRRNKSPLASKAGLATAGI